MRAYRLLGQDRAQVVDVRQPEPKAGEVLLRVLAAGVCRTDLGLLKAPGAVGLPVTLGHEIVGEVVAAASEVPNQPIGVTGAVYELIGCGVCPACRRGEDNLCRAGSPEVPGITRDGGMAEFVTVPARNVVALDDLDPVAVAPLTDAGMTALHAVERGRSLLAPPATAVVMGIGGLGHLAVQFLRVLTDARVIAIDVDPARLDLAAELGADDGVLSREGAAEHVLSANKGMQVDVVFDFVGRQESLDLAAKVTGRGGGIVVTGGGGGRLCLTAETGVGRVPEREVMMIHTFGGNRADLAQALMLARTGRVTTKTMSFPLEQANQAIAALEGGSVVGRAVLIP
jgi:alcohol dehydrogenase, propanol-preferring